LFLSKEKNGIVLSFNTQGRELNLSLKNKDSDHATGSLMGMIDIGAERVKRK